MSQRPLLVGAGAFLLAAVAVGLVWPMTVDPVTVRRLEGGFSTDELALAQQFDNDGWFMVLGAVVCGVLGLVLATFARLDELVTVALVPAAALVAALVAAHVGTWAGPDDPARVLAASETGGTAEDTVEVRSAGAYLAWPGGALLGVLAAYSLPTWHPRGTPLRRSPGTGDASSSDGPA